MAAKPLPSDPGSSFWVAASAGTGKTKVLIERLLRILLSGAGPEKILCITYTKAAAAEISSRINSVLSRWAIIPDGELKTELLGLNCKAGQDEIDFARQLFTRIIDNSRSLKIQTIHGFCQAVLGRFPLESGLSPNFKVIDQQTADELIEEAKRRLLLNLNKSEELKESVENIASELHEAGFAKIIAELLQKRVMLQAFLIGEADWRQAVKEFFTVNKSVRELREELMDIAPEVIDVIKTLVPSSEKDMKRLADLVAIISAAERTKESSGYLRFFLTENETPLVSLFTQKMLPKDSHAEAVLKREQQRVCELNEKIKTAKIARNTLDLLNIAEAILAYYSHLKGQHSYIDYDDLIVKTFGLFSNKEIAPWVMYKLDGGIDHILLDEAQDTSPFQWQIIENIVAEFFAGEGGSGDKTVFIVGDEKQSIYSFQGADHKVFGAMHRKFTDLAGAALKSWFTFELAKSYRSTCAILETVDRIFSSEIYRGAISNSRQAIKHEVNRIDEAGRFEVWPLINSLKNTRQNPLDLLAEKNYDPKNIEALSIAHAIKRWMDEKRQIPARGRAVKPGDILVLVRKRDRFIDYLVRALKDLQVAVSGIDKTYITDEIAVKDLLAMAKFVLLPVDDLNLAAVLKNPLLGLTEDDLFELAYQREGTIWQRLAGNQKYQETYCYLAKILALGRSLRPFEFFSYLLNNEDGYRKIYARLGLKVQDPINEFLQSALNYERSHMPSLQGFLHWLQNVEGVVKRDFDFKKNEVKIMTVHAAKGLEAPIVFLAGANSIPKFDQRLFWAEENNIVPLYVAKSGDHSQFSENFSSAKKQESYNEYLRLLYVAMTRAEDELYITGTADSKGKADGKSWYGIVKSQMKDFAAPQKFSYPDFAVDYQPEALIAEYRGGKVREEKAFKELATRETQVPDALRRAFDYGKKIEVVNLDLADILVSEPLLTDIELRQRNRDIANILRGMSFAKEEFAAGLNLYLSEKIPANAELQSQVKNIVNAYPELFYSSSLSDIDIARKIDGVMYRGRVEKLFIGGNKVKALLFDYDEKSISAYGFSAQTMEITLGYRRLLEELYSSAQISLYLLNLSEMQIFDILGEIK